MADAIFCSFIASFVCSSLSSHKQDSHHVRLMLPTMLDKHFCRPKRKKMKRNENFFKVDERLTEGKEKSCKLNQAAEIKAPPKPHSPSLLRLSLYSESPVQQQELFKETSRFENAVMSRVQIWWENFNICSSGCWHRPR